MPKVTGKSEIRNVGASVRARLQNLSRETGQSFELILTRYALERLLYSRRKPLASTARLKRRLPSNAARLSRLLNAGSD